MVADVMSGHDTVNNILFGYMFKIWQKDVFVIDSGKMNIEKDGTFNIRQKGKQHTEKKLIKNFFFSWTSWQV